MRLVDGANQLKLTVGGLPTPIGAGYSGVVVKDYDLGFPTSRDVVGDYPGQSGQWDLTSLHGSRIVKLDTAILDIPGQTRHQTMDILRSMCHPSHRPQLYVQAQGWSAERLFTLRGTPVSCVVGPSGAAYLEATFAWVCPSGIMTTPTQQVVVAPIQSSATGLAFATLVGGTETITLSFPLSWTPGSLTNTATITNNGTENMPWVAQFYGAANGIAITNQTTGQTFVCNQPIADGHYLQVDTGARTALIDNTPSNSAFGTIDFTQTSWWTIPPGTSTISVTAVGSDASAVCYFNYASGWV